MFNLGMGVKLLQSGKLRSVGILCLKVWASLGREGVHTDCLSLHLFLVQGSVASEQILLQCLTKLMASSP